MTYSGGKDLLKAGSGCPSSTSGGDSLTHGGGTNTHPKVQNILAPNLDDLIICIFYSVFIVKLCITMIYYNRKLSVYLGSLSLHTLIYFFFNVWFFVSEKERPALRPARSMDSLSTPPYPNEGAALVTL